MTLTKDCKGNSQPCFEELIKAGFTQEQIIVAYDMTFYELRQQLENPGKICEACADEIAYTYDDKPTAWVADRYKCTHIEVRDARNRTTKILHKDKMIEDWIANDMSLAKLARIHKCAEITAKRILQQHFGPTFTVAGSDRYRKYKPLIAVLLTQKKSPTEIAKITGAAIGTVYTYAHQLGLTTPIKSNRLSEDKWQELLAKLMDNSKATKIDMADLANEYGITRASIYKRMKKENINPISRKRNKV
jgi:transposase